MRRYVVAAALLAGSRLAAADPVAVKVVELAADVAYVEPGRAAGVVPGARVTIGGRQLIVLEASDKSAVLQRDAGKLALGDTGTVDVKAGEAAASTGRLATPKPLSAWTGQWGEAPRPAAAQKPKPVPLGAGSLDASATTHVTVLAHGMGSVDKSGADGQAEGRVIASFDRLADRPLGADLDVAARAFGTGWNTGAQTPIFVRAAQLRYGGAAADPMLAIGRLRYAASAVGMLDGGRVAVRTGAYEIAAFGGLVPDPISGTPDTSASRFGVEAAYDDAKAAWQPRIGVTAYGSTWQGAVDERRVALSASAAHEATAVSGWAEVQSFASGNPFGASSVEVTGAGASGEWRAHGLHVGVDATYLTPERSLRLLAALPAEWLCTRVPQRGDVMNEACQGGAGSGDRWAALSGSAGWRDDAWTLDAVGSIGTTHGVVKSVDMSGYLRAERRFGTSHLELAAASGRASFVRWISGDVGVGVAPSRRYDLAIRYRPELLDYEAGTGAYLLHSLSFDMRYSFSPALDLGLSSLATTGPDRDAIVLLTTLAWRPLP